MNQTNISKIILASFLLISCSNSQDLPKEKTNNQFDLLAHTLSLGDIFNQSPLQYYLLIYSPSCLACISALEVVEYRYNQNNFDIYFLDYNQITNRIQEGNINKTKYEEITISRIPTLLYIHNKMVEQEIIGYESIHEYDFYNQNMED